MERLFTTYTIESSGIPEEDSIDDYVIGLWFQQNKDLSLTAYMPIACEDIAENLGDVHKQRFTD